jgi:hypothetical protein
MPSTDANTPHTEWGFRYPDADGRVITAVNREIAERLINMRYASGSRKGELVRPGCVLVRRERSAWVPADQPTENHRLSRMLFEAREHLSMWSDVVEIRSGTKDVSLTRLIAEIDAYRAERGWSPNGFGGES